MFAVQLLRKWIQYIYIYIYIYREREREREKEAVIRYVGSIVVLGVLVYEPSVNFYHCRLQRRNTAKNYKIVEFQAGMMI